MTEPKPTGLYDKNGTAILFNDTVVYTRWSNGHRRYEDEEFEIEYDDDENELYPFSTEGIYFSECDYMNCCGETRIITPSEVVVKNRLVS